MPKGLRFKPRHSSMAIFDMDTDKDSIRKFKSMDSISTASLQNDSISLKSNSRHVLGSRESINSIDSFLVTLPCGDSDVVIIKPVAFNKNICHSKSLTKAQRCCWNFNVFCSRFTCFESLFTSGWLLFVTGVVILFGYWNFCQLTTSVHYVEGNIPSYASGIVMAVSGLLSICASFKRNKLLISLIIALSIICSLFCAFSLFHLLGVVNKRLSQLEHCHFNNYKKICSCYINSDGARKVFRFAEAIDCHSVKENLQEIVKIVGWLFAVGCGLSVITATASIYLLQKEMKKGQLDSVASSRISDGDSETKESSIAPRLNSSNDTVCSFSSRRTTENDKNQTVSTQTPLCALPSDVLQMSEEDDDSAIDFRQPPPSYHDAITKS